MKLQQLTNKNDVKFRILWNILQAMLILTLIRYLLSNGFLYLEIFHENMHINQNLCKFYGNILQSVYFACVSLIFSFLWLRNYIVYKNPLIRHLYTKTTNIISWLSLILFNGCLLISLFINTLVKDVFSLTEYGCIRNRPKHKLASISFVILIACHISLLGLFMHPLRKHVISAKASKSSNTLNKTLRLSAISTLMIISSIFISSAIAEFFLSTISPHIYSAVLYDVNLLFSIYSIFYTFADYNFKDFSHKSNTLRKQKTKNYLQDITS